MLIFPPPSELPSLQREDGGKWSIPGYAFYAVHTDDLDAVRAAVAAIPVGVPSSDWLRPLRNAGLDVRGLTTIEGLAGNHVRLTGTTTGPLAVFGATHVLDLEFAGGRTKRQALIAELLAQLDRYAP